MKRIMLESPYAGYTEANVIYARRCVLHALSLGESSIAPHLYYPQVLNDLIEDERMLGIKAGLAWLSVVDKSCFYMDRGFSRGMQHAFVAAFKADVPIYARWLDGPVDLSVFGWGQLMLAGTHSYYGESSECAPS